MKLKIIFSNKTYSILNIVGLSIGITAVALILLWVEFQVNFNKKLPKLKNLHYIAQNQFYGDKIETFFVAMGPLSETLNREFPEVTRNTRLAWPDNALFALEENKEPFSEFGRFADSTFFTMLDMEFLYGTPQTAFNEAFPVVISEKMAQKHFGNENPVGKSLVKVNERTYQITGVFKNLPDHISFKFDWLIPFRVLEQDYVNKGWCNPESWGGNYMQCLVELHPNVDVNALNLKLNSLVSEKTGEDGSAQLFVYPLGKMRLYGEFKDGKPTGKGFITRVRLFFWIGIIILLIACINFMNLSTARSEKRSLEVGIRKTFGSSRQKLVGLFMGESAVITGAALLISILLIHLCLPAFNNLINTNLNFSFANPYHTLGLVCVGVICTLFAGSYPAFYLSAFSPLKTLKKLKNIGNNSAVWIRKGLFVFQFVISFVLICATMVIYLQIRHAQNRPLGFEKENLVLYATTNEINQHQEVVINELRKTGAVENAGFSDQQIVYCHSNSGGYHWQGKDPNVNPLVSHVCITPGLLETAGITFIEGNDFSNFIDFSDEENTPKPQVIINQSFANMMGEEGLTGRIIGTMWSEETEIIGIVNDFIYNDMYETTPRPVAFYPWYSEGHLFVRLNRNVNTKEALEKVKACLQQFSPDFPFEPQFMTDKFDSMFGNERFIGKLAFLFAGLAIIISCLGLLGLSAFSAEQRTREIGIRKVFGATIPKIVRLLGKDFMILIGVSFVIAIPLAWWVMRQWLQKYEYRFALNWSLFVACSALVILIVILTISFQAIKAAMTNPIKTIRMNN
jgi:ABC-type antimicrobial peptide transport system permease subunit